MEKRIAILGAGISGLSIAFQLQEINPKLEFVIFERSERLDGGKACTATKFIDEKNDQMVFFDPGASHISFQDKGQHELIYEKFFKKDHPDLFLKDLEEVKKPIYTLNKDGQIEKTQQDIQNFIYKKGISQLAQKLGEKFQDKIKFNSEITSLLKDDQTKNWVLSYTNLKEQKEYTENFDVIVNALDPLALKNILHNNIIEGNQSQNLVQENNLNRAITALKGMNFKKAIAVCLDYQIPKALLGDNKKEELTKFFSISNPDYTHDIMNVTVENEKPGHIPDLRDDDKYDFVHLGLTIQMSQKWSDIYMNKSDSEIIDQVIIKFLEVLKNKDNMNYFSRSIVENADKIFKPKENIWFQKVQKWEYGYHGQKLNLNKCVEDPKTEGLFFGGDILYSEASIPNAIESGIKVAKQVSEVC